MRYWGRRWRVTIGTLSSTDIDITFKAKRTLQPKPGTCEVSLYNLSETHRHEAQEARRALVRIEAGYEDGTWLVFQGDSRKVEIARDGADWITKVTAGDGEHALRTARGSRGFGPDTKLEDVVRYAADAMGVGLGNVSEAIRGAQLDRLRDVFPEGTVLRGQVARELTALLRTAGLEWSVQDGVLQVLPRRGALARSVVRLAPESGLVGSPEIGKGGVVSARALLSPDLVPGARVQIVSAVVSGVYRIEEAEYSGDTRGQDWYANLQLRERS